MIQLFQEAIPFSNKRLDAPASQGASYLNPIIMPFAVNTTIGSNVFETVAYIRNTSIENFYSDVVITLMKENTNPSTEQTNGWLSTDNSGNINFSLNNYNVSGCSLAYPYQGDQSFPKSIFGYQVNYVPVTPNTDSRISVKFNYGYDEISATDWDKASSVLVIPMIGNSTKPDTSYIPVRMRITFNSVPSVFTIRDYFIDVSYVFIGNVV